MRALEFTRLTEEPMTLPDVQRVKAQQEIKPLSPQEQKLVSVNASSLTASQHIMGIASLADNLPANDPMKRKALQFIQFLKQKLLGKETPQLEQEQQTFMNARIDKDAEDVVSVITPELEQDPRLKDATEDMFKAMQEHIMRGVKLGLETGANAGWEVLREYENKIIELAKITARKVLDSAKAYASMQKYEAMGFNPKDASEQELKEYKEMKAKLLQSAKLEVYVKDTIQEIINQQIQQAKTDASNIWKNEENLLNLLTFLQRCSDKDTSYIEVQDLIDNENGTIDKLFLAAKPAPGEGEKSAYKNIITPLLLKTVGKSGAGAWGPAELGLLMLCKPVRKGTKGDIATGSGQQIEIKASKDVSAGARFNVDDAKKGNQEKDWIKLIKEFFPDQKAEYANDTGKIDTTGKKMIEYANFNASGFKNYINEWIKEAIQKGTWSNTKTEELLKRAISIPMENYVTKKEIEGNPFNWTALLDKYIPGMVDANGYISYEGFLQGYGSLLFDIYQMEMLDMVLVINPLDGHYSVIKDSETLRRRTGNPEQRSYKDNVIRLTGGIDWRDKQSTKSPQIGIKGSPKAA